MTTGGEGGMVTTNDLVLADIIRSIRSHGMTDRHTHTYFGCNNRMSEIQAAIGIEQLKKLDSMNSVRQTNSWCIYHELKDKFQFFIDASADYYHTFFWLPMCADEKLRKYLIKNEIEFRNRYFEPLYKQPIMKKFVDKKYSCPIADNYSGKVIGLPNHHKLTDDELSYVIDTLRSY
jgi:perosamine synthetase